MKKLELFGIIGLGIGAVGLVYANSKKGSNASLKPFKITIPSNTITTLHHTKTTIPSNTITTLHHTKTTIPSNVITTLPNTKSIIVKKDNTNLIDTIPVNNKNNRQSILTTKTGQIVIPYGKKYYKIARSTNPKYSSAQKTAIANTLSSNFLVSTGAPQSIIDKQLTIAFLAKGVMNASKGWQGEGVYFLPSRGYSQKTIDTHNLYNIIMKTAYNENHQSKKIVKRNNYNIYNFVNSWQGIGYYNFQNSKQQLIKTKVSYFQHAHNFVNGWKGVGYYYASPSDLRGGYTGALPANTTPQLIKTKIDFYGRANEFGMFFNDKTAYK